MSSAAAKKVRPKYLNLRALLFEIRQPVPAWVSILHRISGALLVFPFAAWLLYMLDASLASAAQFQAILAYLELPLVKLGMLAFIWAFSHHLCAGIRFLVLDLNRGIELAPARRSAVAVLVASLALTAFFGAKLW
jgi:succinate dehydrogenase / fumarate reductase, cytochrome b subunit